MLDDPLGKTPAEIFEELRLDLHELARSLMAKERPEHTLQPTALLNEVYISVFAREKRFDEMDRAQIVARSARAMQHILTDHARRRAADKRGGNYRRVPLDGVLDRCATQGIDTLDLEDALSELGRVHPRPATGFTLKFIAGFQVAEIASQLGVTSETIRTDILLARAWLSRKFGRDPRNGT